jgi:hypothetical protein
MPVVVGECVGPGGKEPAPVFVSASKVERMESVFDHGDLQTFRRQRGEDPFNERCFPGTRPTAHGQSGRPRSVLNL